MHSFRDGQVRQVPHLAGRTAFALRPSVSFRSERLSRLLTFNLLSLTWQSHWPSIVAGLASPYRRPPRCRSPPSEPQNFRDRLECASVKRDTVLGGLSERASRPRSPGFGGTAGE